MDNSFPGQAQTSESRVLENITGLSNGADKLKQQCASIHSLLNEGTYKIEAVLNIIDNLKTKEKTLLNSEGDETVVQQITEEQIDSFLEILRTPAFQSLIKQFLTKWVTTGKMPGVSS